MAVVKTNKIPQQAASLGGLRARIIDVALATNDYTTGGIAVLPSEVSLAEIYGVAVLGQDAAVVGYLPVWDQVNGKVLLFQQTDPAAVGGANVALVQVTNASSTAVTFRLLVLGV